MDLCISSIIKDSDCITVNLCTRELGDYELIDAAAILLLAVESRVKMINCIGEAVLQAKPLARLAATLKPLGIAITINTGYTPEELIGKAKRGKYLKALLDYSSNIL